MTKPHDTKQPPGRWSAPPTPGGMSFEESRSRQSSPVMRAHQGVMRVTNFFEVDAVLVLEPWADEHPLAAGQSVDVAYSGPAGGMLEIEVRPGRIVLYGWEGSLLEISGYSKPRFM
jgi:hypothetical protein